MVGMLLSVGDWLGLLDCDGEAVGLEEVGDADGEDDGCIDIVGLSLGLSVGLYEIEGASVGYSDGDSVGEEDPHSSRDGLVDSAQCVSCIQS